MNITKKRNNEIHMRTGGQRTTADTPKDCTAAYDTNCNENMAIIVKIRISICLRSEQPE